MLDARTPVRAPTAVVALRDLPVRIVVMVGERLVDHPGRLWFHRRLADRGRILVQDTTTHLGALPETGEIVPRPTASSA